MHEMSRYGPVVMILYYVVYLNGFLQVHVPERAQVEQECIFFHLSSA